jgi:hypothetical protein
MATTPPSKTAGPRRCQAAAPCRHGGKHTKLACQTLAGLSAEEAVRTVNAAFLGLPSDGKEPAYEILRRQVQVQLALREELAV